MRECRTYVMAGKRRPASKTNACGVVESRARLAARAEHAGSEQHRWCHCPGKNACYLNAPPKRLVVSPIGESHAISTNGPMCSESRR
jgi:hypothetical protein